MPNSLLSKFDQIDYLKEPEEQMGLIFGKTPGSIFEWRFALALQKAGWKFQYQVSVFGGRTVKGGQVVDFLVETTPLPTPAFVDGEHWHNAYTLGKEDEFKRNYLDSVMQGLWNGHIVFYGLDLYSQEIANDAVMRDLGRGIG